MTVAFPALRPTSRQYKPPRWPVTDNTSQSGVTSRRLWGSSPSQATLSLSFNNRPTSEGAAVTAVYKQAKGNIDDIGLPASLFDGDADTYNDMLSTFAEYGLRWYFTQDQPDIESVIPGVCNIRVNLVAELRIGQP